jgi:hypothetical protein
MMGEAEQGSVHEAASFVVIRRQFATLRAGRASIIVTSRARILSFTATLRQEPRHDASRSREKINFRKEINNCWALTASQGRC